MNLPPPGEGATIPLLLRHSCSALAWCIAQTPKKPIKKRRMPFVNDRLRRLCLVYFYLFFAQCPPSKDTMAGFLRLHRLLSFHGGYFRHIRYIIGSYTTFMLTSIGLG